MIEQAVPMQGGLSAGDRRMNALVLVMAYVTLGIVLPVWVLLPLESLYPWDLGRAMALLITQYCAVRLAVLAARGEPRFTAFTFFIFVYVWVGIAASAQLTVQQFPLTIAHRPGDTVVATFVVAAALAAYELGRVWARRRPLRPRPQRLEFVVSKRMVYVVCATAPLFFALGVLMIGSLSVLVGTRGMYEYTIFHIDKTQRLIAIFLVRSPPFVGFMLAAYYSLCKWRVMDRGTKRAMLAWMLVMGALNTVANFPGVLNRAWLSAVVLTPLFSLLPWRRWLAPLWILALTVSAIVVFPYMDAFRNAPTFEAGLDALVVPNNVVDPILHKGDYDVFQQTVNSVVYVDRFGVSWGHNLLSAVFFWVPRAFWPGKSGGTSVDIDYPLGYAFYNLSVPLWMEAYFAFSWIGVLLILGAYGYASARAESTFLESLRDAGAGRMVGLLLPFWGGYQFFIMRGDLMNVFAFSSLSMLLFVLATRVRLRLPGRQNRQLRPT
jgi:hypothetical protein